jgi:hypothetical protein
MIRPAMAGRRLPFGLGSFIEAKFRTGVSAWIRHPIERGSPTMNGIGPSSGFDLKVPPARPSPTMVK